MKADFHEALVQHETGEGPSNRSFGLTVGGILAALGIARSLIRWELAFGSIVMLVVGGVLVSLAVAWPNSLRVPNRLWMQFGALLARIVNPIVLLLVYALAFIPIGLVMRLRGHDLLRLKRAPAGASYWIRRPSPDTMVERMRQQF